MLYNKNIINVLVLVLILLVVSSCKSLKEEGAEVKAKPNIIYILADDMGYGDLSCYGQQKFETPNIDKLAAMGIKFTQHYSGSTVCAPSRSSLMTGQHTGHTPIRGNKELPHEGQTPLPAESVTIAELLKGVGYKTGAFGKWGLGFIGSEGDPNNQGFDEFYGYNCQRMAHRYYPPYLWHNDQKVLLKGNDWTNTETYAPDEIQTKTLQFIEENKNKPFFAYVPLIQPHAELLVPDDEVLDQFKGKFEEKPMLGPHKSISDYGKDMNFSKYCSQEIPYATYAAMIARIDIYVGQIIAKVKELGIENNTIILFTSDNGPHAAGGANPDFFNSAGGLKGIKRDLYEGGIRCPLIAVWPEKIKPSSNTDHISAFWDVMPTIADIAGTKPSAVCDGISFLPTLLGKVNEQADHEYLYWGINLRGGRKAIRYGDWKGVAYNVKKKGKETFELFNLAQDEQETTDLGNENPEIVIKLKKMMEEAHTDSELFPF